MLPTRIFLSFLVLVTMAMPGSSHATVQCGNGYTCPDGQTCQYDLDAHFSGCISSGTGTTGGSNSGGTGPTGVGGPLINPLGSQDLWGLVNSILTFLIRIGAIVIVFMIVYVGFLFVTARGEPDKLTVARSALLWTIVGALILLGAKAISLGICQTAAAISTSGGVSCPIF